MIFIQIAPSHFIVVEITEKIFCKFNPYKKPQEYYG